MEIINPISEFVSILAMDAALILLAMSFAVMMAQLASRLFDG